MSLAYDCKNCGKRFDRPNLYGRNKSKKCKECRANILSENGKKSRGPFEWYVL